MIGSRLCRSSHPRRVASRASCFTVAGVPAGTWSVMLRWTERGGLLGSTTSKRELAQGLVLADGDEALEDIARFVGHARPGTTAGYVKRLGRRPQSVAERAAAILDDYGRREGAE